MAKIRVVVAFCIAAGCLSGGQSLGRSNATVADSLTRARGEDASRPIASAIEAATLSVERTASRRARIAQAEPSQSRQKAFVVVVLASERAGGQTGYEQVSVQTEEVPLSERNYKFSATCASAIAGGTKAYALLTNPPENIGQISNGDKLLVNAPLCAQLNAPGQQSRANFAIKMAGGAATRLDRAQPQYVVVGDLLSQEPAEISLSTTRDCESCPRMVDIPGGSFLMGSDLDPAEQPVHEVTVPPFLLSQFPVTIAEWKPCVAAKACPEAPLGQAGSDATPVYNVSWDDARQYIAWLTQTTHQSYRLPSEAEWEYAARARTTTAYWWGDRLADGVADCHDCGQPYAADRPIEMESLLPNPFGLFGVAGGVQQWVADCCHPSYEGAPTDGSAWEAADCRERVLRGGSWRDEAARLRAASRDHFGPGARRTTQGFRVARGPAVALLEAPPEAAEQGATGTAVAEAARNAAAIEQSPARNVAPPERPVPEPRIAPAGESSAAVPGEQKTASPPGALPTEAALAAPTTAAPATSAAAPNKPALHKQTAPDKQSGQPEGRFTTGIVTGNPQTTDFLVAYEIASVLSSGQETGPHGETALRVIPMVGKGGLKNISDVLTLPGADMAIVPTVLLNRAQESKEFGDLKKKLTYIAPLYLEEFHLIAVDAIRDIHDLAGKTVNVGEEDTAAAVLGRDVFSRLGIKVNEVNVDFATALALMRKGEIAATLVVSGKPVKSLTSLGPGPGLHLLAVPYPTVLQQDYLPSVLKSEDYPDLIPSGQSIDTISVSSVLVAYNWPPRSERFRLLEYFVHMLFARLPELQTGSHHPKWQEVNLAASLPGWRRFQPAQSGHAQHP